jgi:biotin carboxylase
MTFRILLTSTGGGLAPQAIQYLRHQSRHGRVHVVAVDTSKTAASRHFADAFEIVPHGTDPGYAARLAEIAERHAVDLVLPWSDEEALAAAGNRELIETNGRRLACADIAVLETVSDKTRAYEALGRAGLPVPRWERARSLDEIAAAVERFLAMGLDIAVKPAISRGSRDVSVIRADVSGAGHYGGGREVHMDAASFKKEYLPRYAGHFPVIVMERLFEPTFDLDILADRGKVVRSVGRRRINPPVPNDGHIIESRRDLYDLAPGIARSLGLTWLYDCDLMVDRNDKIFILEVNPRPSGSTALVVAAGVPMLDDLISLALGETLPPIDIPAGRVVVPYTALVVAKDEAVSNP